MSSNGRPGTRQGVRTPHLRAAMPVDAYSLAVSCGGRGVSCDIWPAGLVRHAPRRALPVLRARRGSPRPARCAAPRPFAATPVSPALRVSAQCGFLPSVVPPPSPRYRGCGGPCPAMRRPPTPLRCGLALGRHLRVTPSRRALPSRPRRAWRPIDAGHSSRASPRRHQLSSYRNACRHWPGRRFCAPSLPDSRNRRHEDRAVAATFCNDSRSDGAAQAAQRWRFQRSRRRTGVRRHLHGPDRAARADRCSLTCVPLMAHVQ